MVRFGRTSIYKFAPYILKPYFEEITYNFKDNNVFAYPFDDCIPHLTRVLSEEGFSVNENVNNRMTILHTFGAHQFTSIREYKEISDYINLFLSQLMEADLYDRSTIIITADHGKLGSFAGDDPQPILMVKKPYESNDILQSNHAPVSEIDFQATILELIGEKDDAFGSSIWDISEQEERERTYFLRKRDNLYFGYTYHNNGDELISLLSEAPSVEAEYVPEHE